ncbi:MAG TPA: hypothetical protein VMN60_12050 [Longimicrobiales bacterium]|nr:hypothetical protein [Longimicrobiales bacterium]
MTRCAIACMVLAAPCAAQRPQPWLAIDAGALRDNQPLSRVQAQLEYGRYLTDDIGVMLLADVVHSAAGDASSNSPAAGAAVIAGVPALRLGTVMGARLLAQPASSTRLLWHARANMRLGADVQLRAHMQRDRYMATSASLDTVVLVRNAEIALDRSGAPGWAGVVALRRDDYDDDNHVNSAYAWLLVPLRRAVTHSFRAGYAVGWQDSPQSRWVAAPEQQPPRGPAAVPGAIVPGTYDPYYTPHDQLTHSLIADAALAAGSGWLKFNGMVGVRATELAPQLRNGGPLAPAGTIEFVERSFTPYRAGASWWAPLNQLTFVTLDVEYARTAFYDMTRARLKFLRVFGGR